MSWRAKKILQMMDMNLSHYADWTPQVDGIWKGNNDQTLSYPEAGHEACFGLEDASWWFQHRNSIITSLVCRHAPHGVFFDVGGGNGCVTKALQDRGIVSVLVEPGRDGPQNAVKRGCRYVVQSLWARHIVRPGVAPAVGLFDVVEHIENDVDFLSDLSSTLVPSGKVFITVPAYTHLWSDDDMQAGHFRRYSLRSLNRLLVRAGFTVRFASYFFLPVWLPMLLVRTIPSMLGLRRAADPAVQSQEHSAPLGLSGKLLQRMLDAEKLRIDSGKTLPFGTSCIAIAEKN